MCAEETHRVLKSQLGKVDIIIAKYSCNQENNVFSLVIFTMYLIIIYQTLIKIKHNRDMVGKICPNMKLTPRYTHLSSTTEHLGKISLHAAFTL